jgi:hypothetical protein
MKPEHTKNIKKFIKKYKSVLKLPFMDKLWNKSEDKNSTEAVAKPIVQILPSLDQAPEEETTSIATLAAKYDPNAKVSGGFGKSPIVTILNSGNKKEAALTGEVKSDGPETIVRSLSGQSDSVIPYSYLKPTDTPRVMSSSNKLISLPKTDVKKLVDLSLTKQITNKITKTKNNEYSLNIPEYGIGKNILSGLMNIAAKAKPAISKVARKFGSALTEKLSPLTDALKSAKNMGMSLIAEEKRNEPSSAPAVAAEPQSTPALLPDPPTPHVASKEFPSQDVDGNPVSAEQHKAALDNSLHIAGGGEAGAQKREQIRAADNAVNAAEGKPLIEANEKITPEQISKNKEIINTIPGMAATPAPAAPAAPAAAAPAPAAAAPAAAPVAASGSISAAAETPKDAPTKIEGKYESGVGPGTSAEELKSLAENAQNSAAPPEKEGAGADRGIAAIGEAVTFAAQVAGTVATGGAGGAAFAGLKGVAGLAGGAGKIAGGLGKAGKVLGAVSGGEGGGGEGGVAAVGGGGGMGVAGGGMSSMLGAVGVAAAGGGALAAVGGIAAGVGGVAAGIGAAVGGIAGAYGTVAGKLIDAVFGGDKKDEKPPVNNIMNDSRSTTTIMNSISNQYDIYRKTADDSFMLPNHRREYG